MYKLVTSGMVIYLFRSLSIVLSFGVFVVLLFIFWFCFRCWFLGFFGYSKSYFSVNSNKDNITDTVVYVSFSFFFCVKL